MKIDIQTIDHSKQRYPTVGDWYFSGDTLFIRISKMSDARYEFLVLLHELVEWKLCDWAGITVEMVDEFDKKFEDNRHPDNIDEPGDDGGAPYRIQHCIATGIERIVAALLGVNWNDYAKEVQSL